MLHGKEFLNAQSAKIGKIGRKLTNCHMLAIAGIRSERVADPEVDIQ
jgi:hypothetical protein